MKSEGMKTGGMKTGGMTDVGRRRRPSPLLLRILAINVLALAIPVVGLLYLGDYRKGLIASAQDSLGIRAGIVAGALGEGAVAENAIRQTLQPSVARPMVRRLAITTGTRARLVAVDGGLIADSRLLPGNSGAVEIRRLPPPEEGREPIDRIASATFEVYDGLVRWLSGEDSFPSHMERPPEEAGFDPVVRRALTGDVARAVRQLPDGTLLLLVAAVPVQRYKQVLGAVMLSREAPEIEEAVLEVRLDILTVFGVALSITILLSIYLAGTIARPLHRLSEAAQRVRHGHSRQYDIPDFGRRRDEIADLAHSLRDMTEALWQRLDAIERFAADVAHEIKNPLTSLRSAVETAARIKDPEQQRRLMEIIVDDVARLDRLITDISNASRLDAELSRGQIGPVDLSAMVTTLADMYATVSDGEDAGGIRPPIEVSISGDGPFVVSGMEDRLFQVLRNLLNNADSFSPDDGVIRIELFGDGPWICVAVDDGGPGIPEGKEDGIFERFYTQRPEGEAFGTHSGLGLSISRQIVTAHDGTITAANRRDGAGNVIGARFLIRLPPDPASTSGRARRTH